jgi:8-oxo-dGTP diphosphatase
MEAITPLLSTDIIIEKDNKVILIHREIEPFKNTLTLPGGHVEIGETVENAAIREAKEETGLNIKLKEILGIYSEPKREPRGHFVSVSFIAEVVDGKLEGSFEGEPKWYSLDEIDFDNMGFDHGQMLRDFIKWKKTKETFWSSK